jgi:hypothetical protein
LPDVLLYEGIDRALELPDRDWNTKFHALYDPLIVANARGKETSREERLEDAPPTHAWDLYAGNFTVEGYPDFAVRRAEEGLEACLVGSLDWSELRHYHFNLFEWYLADFDEWVRIQFLIDEQGEIDAISIPIEPEVDNVTFHRKEPEITEALVTALTGEYVTAIEGLAFTVTAHEGKVYAAQTGAPPTEIKCYKVTHEVVGFRMERARLDFVREGDRILCLVIKTPGMTLEAARKP